MNAVEINGLQKFYANGVVALKGVDLKVEQGDFFALLGPNGAGKSTAIGILCSLVNKSSGSVRVFGEDLDAMPMAVKRMIGLVPQEFNFNVFEPVLEIVVNQAGYYGIARKQATEKAEYFLKKLDLWGKRFAMAGQLSGGMKRRLMIARALVHEPKLLILDEPTAGVDIEIRRSMWGFLREINHQGTTIILTTHYLEEAESLCRNMAIIDQGKIVEQGEVRTLLKQLQTETFLLNIAQPLPSLPELKGFSLHCQEDGRTLEVEVNKGQSINALFAELTEKGIEVLSMKNKSNRLEAFFLRLIDKNAQEKL
ncbi:MAG: ABC transporter ATP-binding protein [Gammaproteobacteria bacterium]|nr:ABC transporter ATP-binding protein [Gammaproteobacteria bacterium]